ncbi:hypothetical protein AQY21_08065 [Paracoccus sp. MKU1]|nr:hypothetical protein AQY21_08065 [Paracoccus sp. MKU1]
MRSERHVFLLDFGIMILVEEYPARSSRAIWKEPFQNRTGKMNCAEAIKFIRKSTLWAMRRTELI